MKFKLIISVVFLFLLVEPVNAQSDSTSKSSTSLFLYTNWSSTYRKLIVNEGLFADSIGFRVDETKYNLWSFGLGFRSDISNNITVEGGVAFQRNGERYDFEESDTLYKYDSQYNYISMPIKVYYKYGKRAKVIAGVGVVPQLFVNFKQTLETVSKDKQQTKEDIKTKIGYNSFVFSTVFNVGFEYDLSEKTTIIIMPEYRLQLTSSYLKTNGLKHFGRSLGLNIGLSFYL
ncbi:MAG: hypothetical protein COA33_001380 [Fluviicola sp.]|nr:hypothetical protein [Fluviicola sp.]